MCAGPAQPQLAATAGPARTQSATGQERPCPRPETAWGPGNNIDTTAILRMDALTEVHLSCLRSITRMNPMPASCRLKLRGHGQHAPRGLAVAVARLPWKSSG